MAMSVAEKPVAAVTRRSPHFQLAFSSLLGALYVLVSLWVVFAGLPYLWGSFVPLANEFLSDALLLIATLVVGLGLWFVGMQLERSHAQHGLRAGVFFAALSIFVIAWLGVSVIGRFLENRDVGAGGAIITIAIVVAMAYGVFWTFLRPGFADWLGRVEDRGWFHALPYKPTQGVRVRRSTVLAILVLGICGIITLITHRSLGYERADVTEKIADIARKLANPNLTATEQVELTAQQGGLEQQLNNWQWTIPFTAEEKGDDVFIPLMFKVHLVAPLVLAVALFWVAWRVVNWPTFADFLIATEAEMNKVSWTTRKRLVQDTIVVLVTVFLLTVFLFVIDIVWIRVLSNPFFQVLHVDLKAEQQKQQEKSQW
jgi:preprotein translocase SecE subunit